MTVSPWARWECDFVDRARMRRLGVEAPAEAADAGSASRGREGHFHVRLCIAFRSDSPRKTDRGTEMTPPSIIG